VAEEEKEEEVEEEDELNKSLAGNRMVTPVDAFSKLSYLDGKGVEPIAKGSGLGF